MELEKKSILVLFMVAFILVLLLLLGHKVDKDKTELTDSIENRYQGCKSINGIMIDNNCSIDDPVVIKITEYLEKMALTSSILKQVTEPDINDAYHQFLLNNIAEYDGHTYWLYPDGFSGHLFYAIGTEPKVIKVALTY